MAHVEGAYPAQWPFHRRQVAALCLPGRSAGAGVHTRNHFVSPERGWHFMPFSPYSWCLSKNHCKLLLYI